MYFWFITSIGAFMAFLMLFTDLGNLFNHDVITYNIESYMAYLIYICMVTPGVWNVKIVDHRSEESKKNDVVIIAPNHESIIDTLFVALLPFKKTYSYNKKWGWVPVFGWMSQMAGYISIDKSNKEKLKQVVPEVVKRLRCGYSIMLYPEGTRNRNPHRLHKHIKTGAFRMAKQSEKPILPVVFVNTHKACSRYGVIDFADIEIHLMEPMFVPKYVYDGSALNVRVNSDNEFDLRVAMAKYRNTIDSVLAEHY